MKKPIKKAKNAAKAKSHKKVRVPRKLKRSVEDDNLDEDTSETDIEENLVREAQADEDNQAIEDI